MFLVIHLLTHVPPIDHFFLFLLLFSFGLGEEVAFFLFLLLFFFFLVVALEEACANRWVGGWVRGWMGG